MVLGFGPDSSRIVDRFLLDPRNQWLLIATDFEGATTIVGKHGKRQGLKA